MKFRILIVFALVLTAFFSSCEDDEVQTIGNWQEKAYLSTPARARTEGTSFGLNNYGYFGLGKDADNYYSDFWKYDPVTNNWTQLSDFPGTPRAFNISVNTAARGYMGLGYDGTNDLKDFWEYNPENDTWTQLPNFINEARREAAAFAIGNDVYVGTGTSEKGKIDLNDFCKFSNGEWTKIASLSGKPRRSSAAVALNGKGYIISGFTVAGANLTDFWSYEPAANTWTQLTSLTDEDKGSVDGNIQRYNAVSFVVDSKMYLATGMRSGSTLNSVFEWTPSTEVWIEKTSFEGDIRQGANSFVINNAAYIMGGNNTYYMNDLWLFEPSKEKVDND